jgi:hypothetical protein
MYAYVAFYLMTFKFLTLHSAITIFILASAGVRSHDPVAYSNSCSSAVQPEGYNLYDLTTQFMTSDYFNKVQEACNADGNGKFKDPKGCDKMLNEADQNINKIFATSDTDLVNIAGQLFGCSSGARSSMSATLQSNLQTMINLNQTIFGNPKTTPADPGLIRILLTLMDGITEIKSVAQGQLQSIKQAASNQIGAAKQIKTNLIATASAIQAATIQAVQALVGNRTLVQIQGFANLQSSVQQALSDLGNQADDIVNGFTGEYVGLSDRYTTWKAQSDLAVQDTQGRATELKANVSEAVAESKTATSQFKSEQLATFGQQIATAQAGFSSSMQTAQGSVATNLNQLASDLATSVSKNRVAFQQDYAAMQQDINGQLQALSTQVENDASVNTNNENEVKTKADASVQSLASLVSNSVLPLVNDVISALKKVTDIQALVTATRNKLNQDATDVLIPAQTAAQSLNTQITQSFGSAQSAFTTQYNQIRTDMMKAIQEKISTGRAQLSNILSGVQSTQSDAADQQTQQGQTAMVAAGASMAAASLSSAKEKTAGDQAQVGLNTMISVVAAALSDSQSTLTDIQKANLMQIMQANGALTASQQATIEQAYNQIQSSYNSAASRTADVQSASFTAQSNAQDLENALAEGGTRMQGSVTYSSNQANSLLAAVMGLVGSTNQTSGDLLNQMTSFETQAPSLVQVLLQKIAAYQTLAVSEGTNAQSGAATTVGNGATSTLNDLVASLQGYMTNVNGVSSSMTNSQAKTSNDATALMSDLQTLMNQLQGQAQSGSSMIQSNANAGLSQALNQVHSMSSDSNSALSALSTYIADLVKQKEATILTSGDNAMSGALSAADYLATAAQSFQTNSDTLIQQMRSLGSQATMNLTSMLDNVHSTLAEVTSASDSYMARLQTIAGSISGWPSQVLAQASAINVEIQQEISNTTAQIVAMQGISPDSIAELRESCNKLQEYINNLLTSFKQQKATFDKFAQNYAIRRIAVITGLSESVVAQKAQYLSSLANADLTESQRASQTTTTLQGLLLALQHASVQGAMDKDQAATVIGQIGNGVNSLTSRLKQQMQTSVESMKHNAAQSGITSGNQLQSAAVAAANSANLIANQFINALETVSKSSTAAELAAAGTDKDIYTIAGLLKNTEASTKLKIANLLRQVQSGNATMADAISAAKNLYSSQISTVQDIINTLAGFIGTHEASVQSFESNLGLINSSVNRSINTMVNEHGVIQGEVIGDLTSAVTELHDISGALLGNSTGSIKALEARRTSDIDDLENYINNILYGSASPMVMPSHVSSSSGSFFQRIRRHTAPQTLPDAISAVKTAIASAQTAADSSNAQLTQDVTDAISAGTNAIKDILSTTRTALQV